MRTRYDTSRQALYHPEIGASVFPPSRPPSDELLCAEASRLVYKKFESKPEEGREVEAALRSVGFDKVKFFSQGDTQALGASNPSSQTVFLAFRGTEQKRGDFATDLDAQRVAWDGKGTVHEGFKEAFHAIWKEAVNPWLQAQSGRLLMTGHSLGAALSTLAASLRNPARLITFGSPRVGDAEFTRTFKGVDVARYVDCCDLITRVPLSKFGYEHVDPLHYIDRTGKVRINPPKNDIDNDRSEAREEYLLHHTWKIGSVAVRDLADHTPLNYVYVFL